MLYCVFAVDYSLLLNLLPVHVGDSFFTCTVSVCPVKSLCLFLFSIVMFDYYKTVIWAVILMS